MKTIILVWGSKERGKSQSIKRLANRLPFNTIIKPWSGDDYDSYVIGTVKDGKEKEKIVGIESLGDPGSCQKIWIEACINAGCEVIVAASRCYGQTKTDAYDLARANGYEVIEVTTYFNVDGPLLSNGTDLRYTFADNMISLIMKCLA